MSQTILLAEDSGLPTNYVKQGLSPQQPEGPDIGAWLTYSYDWAILSTRVNQANRSGVVFSFHPPGAHTAMCDGSIHFLSEGTDERVLAALLSRDGGEAIHATDWQ